MPEQNLVQRITAGALRRKPVRAFLLYSEQQGPALADSVTYRTLFSLFAGVLLGFSALGIVLSGNDDALASVVGAVNSTIPGLIKTTPDGTGLISLSDIEAPGAFTIAGVISVVGLLGAAIGAIGSLRTAMRSIAGTLHDDTLIWWVLLRNLALALGIGAGLVASAVLSFFGTAGIGILLDWFGVEDDSFLAVLVGRVVTIAVVLILDTAVVAVLFAVLAGVRVRARQLWTGALIGGVGLIVLQQLSGLFVGGASGNPLLASVGGLIALLLWLNLSAQVILIAAAYIVTGVEDAHDRVHSVHGAATFGQRRVQQAQRGVRQATDELAAARAFEQQERDLAAKAAAKAAAKTAAKSSAAASGE